MEPEQQTQPEQEPLHVTHTYEDDLSKAMKATDVTEVQELLEHARAQEAEAAIVAKENQEKGWYSVSSTILVILTLGVIGYGIYYYMSLTVPLQNTVSVGVFPNTTTISTKDTDIATVLNTLKESPNLSVGKPELVNLVTDEKGTPLSNYQLYAFIDVSFSQALQAAIGSARLGVVNTGTDILPFLIVSTPDPEQASMALTSEEPTLLQSFARLFGTAPVLGNTSSDTSQQAALSELVAQSQSAQVSTPTVTAVPLSTGTFQSQYFYNLPVRSVKGTDPETGEQRIVFLYGYANNNVIVFASTPEVLKAVYDTLVSQH